MPHERLDQLLSQLTAGEATSIPPQEDWTRMIGRTTVSGAIHEVTEETWDYFLDVLPPRWMGRGMFAFAEGWEPFRLFWKRSGKFFCRQLSWDETRQFERLARGDSDAA